jgi:hypothetical protein
MAGKQARNRRRTTRNHRIAGAGKQPSMRRKSAKRYATPAAKTAPMNAVT